MKSIATFPIARIKSRTALYDELAALLADGPVSVSYAELAYDSDRVAAVAVRQAMYIRGLNVRVHRHETGIAVERKAAAL